LADLAALTVEDFTGRVGERFEFNAGAHGRFELELAGATAHEQGAAPRAPFSLVFHGPPEPVFAQQIFPLEHAELGELHIFLVPLGADSERARYQAVFG
jgi:hypothetical protein